MSSKEIYKFKPVEFWNLGGNSMDVIRARLKNIIDNLDIVKRKLDKIYFYKIKN